MFKDLLELTKPRILQMQLVTMSFGYLLGRNGGSIFTFEFGMALLGTALTAGGAGSINHAMEVDVDSKMERTKNRPLPAGRISSLTAIVFGLGLSAIGLIILNSYVNFLTAAIAFATVALYVWVYTPLKKITWFNTIVGAIPGALPPLGGWAAATATLSPRAWVLFVLLFIWQLPHFYAIAWMIKDDYSKAGLKMLSVMDDDGSKTSRQIIINTLFLFFIPILMLQMAMIHWISFWACMALTLWYLWSGIVFSKHRDRETAKGVLKVSVFYLLGILAVIVADVFFLG